MKKYLPVGLALVAGLVAGALIFRGGGSHNDHDHSGAAGKKSKAEVWTCSMHPQVKSPKPGKCPICAMDLIPLSQLGSSGEGRVYSMSESAKVISGITTQKVERRYPEAEVRLYGTVEYDETKQKTIAARFPGRIDRLYVDYTGIRVQEGDHLATIYSPELLAAQTELLTAKRFNNADALRIARDKLRLWGFPDKRIAEIESSGKTSDTLTIDASVTGIVTHKNVQEGDYVQTGSALFKISQLDELWVMFDAYESDKPWLRFGQKVEFTAEAMPGTIFEGKISFVAPELDMKTRTFAVRVNIENPEEQLKPGMFVRGVVHAKVAGAGKVIDPSLAGKWISPMHPEVVKDAPGKCDVCGMDLVPAEELGYSIADPKGKAPLVIPVGAVLHTGKRSVVYVKSDDAKEPTFEGREVLLGPRAGDVYLVEAGLRDGESVVSEGAFVIDSALQIQARPSMMLPPETEEPLFKQFEVSPEVHTSFDGMLKDYFKLQVALAEDDFKKAKTAAATLQKISDPGTLEDDAAVAFADLKNRIEESVSQLVSAEDLKAARVPFEPLTLAMEEMVRRFGTKDLPVYRAHCPMAFSNKGADWLQENKDILNPYFGDAMLKCGEIKERLDSGDE